MWQPIQKYDSFASNEKLKFPLSEKLIVPPRYEPDHFRVTTLVNLLHTINVDPFR